MKHQLVLQFEGLDFDELVAIEDALIARLGASAEVDGHDFGSGQSNIFILTPEPGATLHESRNVLGSLLQFNVKFKAASRPLGAEDYTVLWPPGTSQFHVI